jgi:hypothetical protein
MTCQACENLLQLHLDGVASPGDLERHLYACPDCAIERLAIERLIQGVPRLRPPAVPADVTERLVSVALAESMVRPEADWRWRVAVASFTLAASVALLLVAWAVWPTQSPHVQPQVAAEQPASLRDSMAEAQSAVVALTSRTANETVETTSQLLPLVAPGDLEAAMAGPIDPAMEPLREATSGVGAAVAPVADSARRAVGLFFRDLPMGRAPGDKNPG